jgi:hypothetical protein
MAHLRVLIWEHRLRAGPGIASVPEPIFGYFTTKTPRAPREKFG